MPLNQITQHNLTLKPLNIVQMINIKQNYSYLTGHWQDG